MDCDIVRLLFLSSHDTHFFHLLTNPPSTQDMSRWFLDLSSSGTMKQVLLSLDFDSALAFIDYTNNPSIWPHLSRLGMDGCGSLVEAFGTGEKRLIDVIILHHDLSLSHMAFFRSSWSLNLVNL